MKKTIFFLIIIIFNSSSCYKSTTKNKICELNNFFSDNIEIDNFYLKEISLVSNFDTVSFNNYDFCINLYILPSFHQKQYFKILHYDNNYSISVIEIKNSKLTTKPLSNKELLISNVFYISDSIEEMNIEILKNVENKHIDFNSIADGSIVVFEFSSKHYYNAFYYWSPNYVDYHYSRELLAFYNNLLDICDMQDKNLLPDTIKNKITPEKIQIELH